MLRNSRVIPLKWVSVGSEPTCTRSNSPGCPGYCCGLPNVLTLDNQAGLSILAGWKFYKHNLTTVTFQMLTRTIASSTTAFSVA